MEDMADQSTYQPDDNQLESPGHLSWEASEFIVNDKPPVWYVGFFVVSVVIVTLLYLLTKELMSLLVVVAVLVFIFVYALRQPRILKYVVSEDGITMDGRTYHFDEFRSFALIQEGGILSIALHPLQRFALPLSIYFDPEHMDQIIEILSYHLPNEAGKLSVIDVWSRKLRL